MKKFITDLPPIQLLLESRDAWCRRYVELAEYIVELMPDGEDKVAAEGKLKNLKVIAGLETQQVGMGLAALDIAMDVVLDLLETELTKGGESKAELAKRLIADAESKIGDLGEQLKDKPPAPADDPLGGVDVAVDERAFKNAG